MHGVRQHPSGGLAPVQSPTPRPTNDSPVGPWPCTIPPQICNRVNIHVLSGKYVCSNFKTKRKNNPKSNQMARRRKEILQKQKLNTIIRKEGLRDSLA